MSSLIQHHVAKKPSGEKENHTKNYAQKYSLQRRDRGSFKKVATLSQSISPEEVLGKYGSGYYVLRSTKPRFKTIWKEQLGDDSDKRFQSLEKRAKYLTYGVVGVAATEAIGFGFTAWKFLTIDERLDRIEAVLRLFKPDLQCPACHKALEKYLQEHCTQCGASIDWPRKFFETANSGVPCFHCKFPLKSHQAFCPKCGQQRPVEIGYFVNGQSPKAKGVIFR